VLFDVVLDGAAIMTIGPIPDIEERMVVQMTLSSMAWRDFMEAMFSYKLLLSEAKWFEAEKKREIASAYFESFTDSLSKAYRLFDDLKKVLKT
jgi:hypothetical protein